MSIIDSAENKKVRFEIVTDDMPVDPRNNDNLGIIAGWHSRYNIGDIQPTERYNDWLETIDPAVILPVFLYDHSGITINTRGFSCPWDSGQVGYIYAPKDKVKEQYGVDEITDEVKKRLKEILETEIKIYDMYLRGEIYGYRIIGICQGCGKADYSDEIDSCYGFYGSDKEQMRDYIPKEYLELFDKLDFY